MPGYYRPIGQAARKSAPEAPTAPSLDSINRLIPYRANTARLRQPESRPPECNVRATAAAARAGTHNVLFPLTLAIPPVPMAKTSSATGAAPWPGSERNWPTSF